MAAKLNNCLLSTELSIKPALFYPFYILKVSYAKRKN